MQQITASTTPAIMGKNSDLIGQFVSYIDRSGKTTKTYITNLKQFFAWLAYSGTTEPQRQDIILYREWLQSEHDAVTLDADSPSGFSYRTDAGGNKIVIICKPNTVKQYLQSVRQFFKWTASEGLYPDVSANVHLPKISDAHRKDSLHPDEVLEIEKSLDAKIKMASTPAELEQRHRLKCMYLLAVNAGLRTVEISRANIKDLETKKGKTWLYIWGKGRNEADQKKPIAPEIKAEIDMYLSLRTDNPTSTSPLFVSTGNRSHGKRIASTTISTMLKRAMQSAGYDSERLTAHSLRHTAGQNVMDITGNNIYKTQLYMRHNNPKTTEIYLDNESAEQDERIATQLYSLYHGEGKVDAVKDQLHTMIDSMTGDQLTQLLTMAKGIIS